MFFLVMLFDIAFCCPCNDSVRPLFPVCCTDGPKTHFFGADSVSCFYSCNVSVFFAGTCNAPNDCSGRGFADQESCTCWPFWGGRDCATAVSGNPCRGHGRVTDVGRHCVCDDDFTGSLCDEVVPVSSFPYGHLAGALKLSDPLFNLSLVSVIDVVVSDADYLRILLPQNKNIGWVNASILFLSRGDPIQIDQGALKLGGSYSKTLTNKGWLLKGGDFGFGNKKLKTKSGVNDGSYMNSVLLTDIYHALGCPVPRVSLSQFFLNGVSHGLVMMYEELEHKYLKENFGNASGNLYKCDSALIYQGNDKSDYDGRGYELQCGDSDDWSDLIDLIQVINNGNLTALAAIFDIDMFLRSQAVEALFADGDGFACSGHNFFLYSVAGKFSFIRHDLDDGFGLKGSDSPCVTKALSFWSKLNLSDWGISVCNKSPLTSLILRDSFYQAQFQKWIQVLVNNVIKTNALSKRIRHFFRNVYPKYLVQDRSYPIDLQGCGGYDWFYTLEKNQFESYIQSRVENL